MSRRRDEEQVFEPIKKANGRGAAVAANSGKMKRHLKYARHLGRKRPR